MLQTVNVVSEFKLSKTYSSLLCLLSCGNGNPLQHSRLENPMDRAWWAAVHGVAKSRARLSYYHPH